jgi:hypothetical protein
MKSLDTAGTEHPGCWSACREDPSKATVRLVVSSRWTGKQWIVEISMKK